MRYVDSALDEAEDASLAAWLGRELPTATQLTLRTGFFSAPALEAAQGHLEGLLARGGELVAVIGGDLLQCDVLALQAMLDICRRYPEMTRVRIIAEPDFQNAKTYHVKHADGHNSAWIGSANFTIGGFIGNLEAAITLSSDDDDPLVVERVRAATFTAAEQPTAAVLDEELIRQLEQRLRESRIGFGRAALGPTSSLVREHAPSLLDQLDHRASGGADSQVVPTGFADLDDVLDGGLRPGTLTIVASRPGVGRSTLVLNMLTRAAVNRHAGSCLFTFDTTECEVLLRVVSAETAIKHTSLRSAQMTDADWSDLAEDIGRMSSAPLYINSGQAPHLEGLCAAITAATTRHGLALVAIDPLSAVLARSFADNREREVADVVRRVKALAMHLRIPVIATAELGRQADTLAWRPVLGDLRDTDVIAQVADVVILLHRPDANHPGHHRMGQADLLLAKNRYGRRATVTLAEKLDVARFQSVARRLPREG